ncbi:MAG: DUF3014 domain-containing protein [Variovorax sp.]
MTPRERALLRADRRDSRAIWFWLGFAVVAAAIAFFGWRWWQQEHPPEPPPERAPVASATLAPPDGLPPLLPPAPLEPLPPLHPIEPPADAPKLPPLAGSDKQVVTAINGVVGAKAIQSFLQSDGFVRRMVATVDNMTREQAPTGKWPVQTTAPRFGIRGAGDTLIMGPDNAARYAPFVQFAEAVDPARAAATYKKLYPLFQEAYEELGYPGKYFNDRLVAVIDHLLTAPEPEGPVRLRLLDVKGQYKSTAPWTRYEFADPKLEALSSGQKIMIRMGLENERRMKVRLKALRAQIVSGRGTTR